MTDFSLLERMMTAPSIVYTEPNANTTELNKEPRIISLPSPSLSLPLPTREFGLEILILKNDLKDTLTPIKINYLDAGDLAVVIIQYSSGKKVVKRYSWNSQILKWKRTNKVTLEGIEDS